jgi:hypothetical protein
MRISEEDWWRLMKSLPNGPRKEWLAYSIQRWEKANPARFPVKWRWESER